MSYIHVCTNKRAFRLSFLLPLDVSERGGVKHEGGAADGTRDSDAAVGLLLLQTTDQHPGTELMGEEVRPEVVHTEVEY